MTNISVPPSDMSDTSLDHVAAQSKRRTAILHIAIDYDNPHRGRPTKAIQWFIDELVDHENIVISLKRTPNPLKTYFRESSSPRKNVRVFEYSYFGLPGGVFLYASMLIVGVRIAKMMEKNAISPDIIHAHKFTFEGIAAWIVSRRLKRRMILSMRGEVELKVLKFKPNYRNMYRQIIREAAAVYFVSAWFIPDCERYLGPLPTKPRLLPNVVRNSYSVEPPLSPSGSGFITVLNLNDWKRKGLGEVFRAFRQAKLSGVDLPHLDVFGGGSERAESEVRALLVRYDLVDIVNLKGKIENSALLKLMPEYKALVLPSRSETFGMVYAEALFAGVPIILNSKSGIAGYIDDLEIAYFVDPGNVADLLRGMKWLSMESDRIKEKIRSSLPEIHRRLSHQHAITQYVDDINAICTL